MFDFIKKLFKRESKNKPPEDTPKNPQGKKSDKDESEPIQDIAINNAFAVINQRIDSSDALMKGVIIALTISFLVLLYEYIQFSTTAFNDYNERVKELNDQRFEFLQKQIDRLESNQATNSATTENQETP